MLTSAEDDTTRLWNGQTGRELAQLPTPSKIIRFVDFLPDDVHFIIRSGSDIYLSDIRNSATFTRINFGYNAYDLFAFFADSKRVIVPGDKGIAICRDIKSDSEILALGGHPGLVISASFSPDGTCLVTGDAEGNAIVWRGFDCHITSANLNEKKRREYIRWGELEKKN